MSHFSMVVVTDVYPNDDVLKEVLAPWHEFECTGIDDQYVVAIDITEEAREEYAKDTTTIYTDPDGRKVYPWNSEGNYNDILRPYYDEIKRELNLPDGWTASREPVVGYTPLEEWVDGYYGIQILRGADTVPDLKGDHKYGWVRVVDGVVTEVIDRTNPNKKWDWWQVGGRYEKKFYAKPSYRNDGLGPVDIVRVADLDKVRMKAKVTADRRGWILDIVERSKRTWDEVCEALPRLTEYHVKWMQLEHPRPRGEEYGEWITEQSGNPILASVWRATWDTPDLMGMPVEEWIDSAPYMTAWGLIVDGEWQEKGSMGWFGMSSDNKDEAVWQKHVIDVVDGLSPDKYFCVVDCHI